MSRKLIGAVLVASSAAVTPSGALQGDREKILEALASEEPACDYVKVDARAPDAVAQFAKLRHKQPVVISGATDSWAARTAWSEERLREKLGSLRLGSGDVHTGVLDDVWEEGLLLGEALNTTTSKPRLLLLRPQSPISQAVRQDFEVPPLLDQIQLSGPHISIGGRGQVAVFNEHSQNWFAHVFGRKLWMVVPPEAGNPSYTADAHPCEYTFRERELPVEERRLKSCVLLPGEIVVLPDHWPHATCNLDDYVVGVVYIGYVDGLSAAERLAALNRADDLLDVLAAPDGCAEDAPNRALRVAAEAGHAAAVRAAIAGGAHVNSTDEGGRAALHMAAKGGWAGVARLLLEARASPEVMDAGGDIPVLEAAREGYLAAVRALCHCPVDEDSPCPAAARGCGLLRSRHGGTALCAAAAGGHFRVAQLLLPCSQLRDHETVSNGTAAQQMSLVELLLADAPRRRAARRTARSGAVGPLALLWACDGAGAAIAADPTAPLERDTQRVLAAWCGRAERQGNYGVRSLAEEL